MDFTLFIDKYGLIGVFLITIISYSVIPFPGEAAVLAAALVLNPYKVILFAFLGSTIGMLSDYYLGYKGISKLHKKKSKWSREAKKLFKKHGHASVLLFGWMPFIGDPLLVLAASFKMNFIKFFVFSTVGRLIYITITVITGVGLGRII